MGGGEVTGQAALDGVVAEACAGARGKQRVMGLAGLLGEPAAQHRDGEPGERGGAFFAAICRAGNYVASRPERLGLGGDRASCVNIFRPNYRLSRNASNESGG